MTKLQQYKAVLEKYVNKEVIDIKMDELGDLFEIIVDLGGGMKGLVSLSYIAEFRSKYLAQSSIIEISDGFKISDIEFYNDKMRDGFFNIVITLGVIEFYVLFKDFEERLI